LSTDHTSQNPGYQSKGNLSSSDTSTFSALKSHYNEHIRRSRRSPNQLQTFTVFNPLPICPCVSLTTLPRPERGSFPLDHDGTSPFYLEEAGAYGITGECKDVMTKYLACIKRVKGKNDEECRGIAKTYLGCRMDRYDCALSTKFLVEDDGRMRANSRDIEI
jgi:hypothetical protein